MKRIHLSMLSLLGCMTLFSCNEQQAINSDKDMSTLTFTEQQASAITAIACNEARGDQSSLLNAINEGFDAKLSANQIKEALSQLYAYTGFPRSLNSLGTLQKVIAQRTDINQGAESSPMPSDYNALTQGTEIQTKLTGQPFNYESTREVSLTPSSFFLNFDA